MKVERALLITFICIFLLLVVWIKFLGASDITVNVEKNGFCKQFGDDYFYDKLSNDCYDKRILLNPRISFSEKEFENYCPTNKFFSLHFYSDCFKSGDAY